MKKITLILMALVSFNFGTAQFLEDFNGAGAAFPPAGWAVYDGANGLGTTVQWAQAGTDPEFRAQCLWEAVTPMMSAEDWIVSPLIPINSTQNVLLFDATDLNAGEFGSELSIRISTTSQTDTTTFVEIENLNEAELGNNTNAVFTSFNVNLAAYLNQSVYIAFVHVQNDGDAITFDNVEVVQGAASVPGNANTPTPADMATGIIIDTSDANADNVPDNSIQFGWMADGSLGAVAPDEYEFLLGDSPTTLVSLGTVPATTTLPIAIRGFFYNTTYYWQIIPKNTAGPATNNPVWSFTTEMGTITAPDAAINPFPADMATNVPIDTANSDQVTFLWSAAATGDAPEAYGFFFGTDPAALNSLGSTTATTVDLTNMLPGTTYYWQLQPRNVGGINTTGPVWQFMTEGTASVNDQVENLFTISPNPTTDFLNIQTEEIINNVTIYNGLGQLITENVEVKNNQIKVNTLSAGLYLLKLDTDNGSQTVQFIKK
ncbi:MAG: choice-of-anchor J domain-containing protein [Nonlabens sp.]|uniref:choice-of-anchor J domain-containing protein n=1 Tax=Nonlabens sp. TaxID=1888209 RepID=UPI003EF93730